jgi:hypothetical protein
MVAGHTNYFSFSPFLPVVAGFLPACSLVNFTFDEINFYSSTPNYCPMKTYLVCLFTLAFGLPGLDLIAQDAPNPLVEQFIKTQIEEHDSTAFSAIKIMTMGSLSASNTTTDFLFTAYKYNGRKRLVMMRRNYTNGANASRPVKTYTDGELTELTEKECQAIMNNHKIIVQEEAAENPKPGEYVYHDYTVNSSLFLSYRCAMSANGKKILGPYSLDLWIDTIKYSVDANAFITIIRSFLDY